MDILTWLFMAYLVGLGFFAADGLRHGRVVEDLALAFFWPAILTAGAAFWAVRKFKRR